MLLGSDLPIFGARGHPAISLRLRYTCVQENLSIPLVWYHTLIDNSASCSLTFYQPMMSNAVVVSFKPMKIYVDVLILSIIPQYIVCASL